MGGETSMTLKAQAIVTLIAAGAGLVAVSAQAKMPEPSQGRVDFPGCRWGEVKGATLSIWSFACGPSQSGAHLVADNKLPGFVLVQRGADGPSRKVVIRTFKKVASAPLQSVLHAIRIASPGPHSANCSLNPAPKSAEPGPAGFTLEPTGAAKSKWDASQTSSLEPDMPCGPLGVAYAGDRYFEALPGDPTTVVFLDMGSEIQIFDPKTLTRRTN
jgi:hypothetical protein